MSLGHRAGPSRAPWRGEKPRSFTRSSSRHWCGSKAGAWATRWISKRTCSCTKTFWQGRPPPGALRNRSKRSEEHTSELQSRLHLVCRLLLEKKKKVEILDFIHHELVPRRCAL